MKASRAALLFLIAYALSTVSSFSQMPQDYWYPERILSGGGTNDNQVNSPRGIAIGPDGLIYVADTGYHRIQVFQSDGTFMRKWGSYGSGDGQLNYPRSIAVGTNGLIYVADRNNHRIQVFQPDGAFVRKWGGPGSNDGGNDTQDTYPESIAVGPDGLIYVAKYQSAGAIHVFQSDGTFVRRWGNWGGGDGQFSHPFGIVVGPDGLIYVSDWGRIQVFQPDGTFVRKWGSGGINDGQVNAPGLAVGTDNLIYVADSGNHRIQVFRSDGTFVRKWGSNGGGDSYSSQGIAASPDGLIYVADSVNSRIQVFRRGYRTPANGIPVPSVTVSQRVGAAYVDIDYTIRDNDSSNVQVAALGFVNGTASMDCLVRMNTFLEGTSNNVGTSISANVPHRLTWDAGADWDVSSGNMKFEILANDGRPMVDFHFITIPSNGPDPDFEIERFPMREADFESCWYWLVATRDSAIDFRTNKVYGAGGSYTGKVLAQSTTTTADGRAFLFERLHVREATTAEVNRARAGATGTINQWAPSDLTDRRTLYNEFGFDSAYTQGEGVWYVVPLP